MLETLLSPHDLLERCGLLLKDGSTVEIPNVADDPVIGYEMDPVSVLPYLTAGSIAGTWHTHPYGEPTLSGEDYSGFSGWPELTHYVVGRVDGETVVKCYKVTNGAIIECE